MLPPSETKAPGGDGPPLSLDALSFPELNLVRTRLLDALTALAADVPASLKALGISEGQTAEVARNAELRTAPTSAAIERYTGVLYDALDIGSFSRAQRQRAAQRLAVASALFGVLRADDPIPAYRLSGGNTLPGIGGLRGVWRPDLEKTLSTVDDLVLDMRSGPYANLAAIPEAITVRVVTTGGATVSHFNKAYKGKLANALATAPREPGTVRGLINIAQRAGMRLEHTAPRELELIID